ncbi:MAG: hypothetical protein K0M70_06455, partial [Arenimonas sp.]|uniref:YhdP family phospholipid transporter n=1 Tax=Arenimonas sp. TaxID=1872635 RepID=UPI0025B976DF
MQSTLVGTAITLPAPLGKDAATPLPLSLQAPLPVGKGEVALDLGQLMRLRGRMGAGSDMTGLIQFGGGPLAPLPAEGLVALGSSGTLDAAGWIAFAAKGDGTGGLRAVDLRVAQLGLLGSTFPDTRLRLQRATDHTEVLLTGAAIEGNVRIPTDLDLGVQGQFERLHWPDKPPPPEVAATEVVAAPDVEEAPGQDPRALPALRFSVKDLRMGALALGEAQLQATPVANGLRVDRFTTRAAAMQLTASGDWLRAGEGRSRSRFDVDFAAGSLGELLAAFGLAGVVEDGETKGKLQGSWRGSPGEFALARFDGRLRVDVGEGQLLDVEPGGGGRVLGLISLAEIPRRLSLDFSDFFEKGFGFNTMGGEFVFADGSASTDLLLINGPAAEIRVSGSTDLRLQRYDQRIEVLPKAGGALPVLGALAGGPVGAAVGAVAQAVLQKPLKQAARTVYSVSGPWKEPKVVEIEKGPPPAGGKAPAIRFLQTPQNKTDPLK